eukprot:g13838.t1
MCICSSSKKRRREGENENGVSDKDKIAVGGSGSAVSIGGKTWPGREEKRPRARKRQRRVQDSRNGNGNVNNCGEEDRESVGGPRVERNKEAGGGSPTKPSESAAGHNKPLKRRRPRTQRLGLQEDKQTSQTRHTTTNSSGRIREGRNMPIAPRSGTRGFRAIEVLLRHPNQTTAIDVWSAGVIMLCIMTRRYPFFCAPDDLTAVAELSCLLGLPSEKQIADRIVYWQFPDKSHDLAHNHISNKPGRPGPGAGNCSEHNPNPLPQQPQGSTSRSSREQSQLVAPAQPAGQACPDKDQDKDKDKDKENNTSSSSSSSSSSSGGANNNNDSNTQNHNQNADGAVRTHVSDRERDRNFRRLCRGEHWPREAFDLLTRCLDLCPETRITAQEALAHPFLLPLRNGDNGEEDVEVKSAHSPPGAGSSLHEDDPAGPPEKSDFPSLSE